MSDARPPDHQTTRPPDHQTPASPDHPCTLPPGLAQSRGRGGGDEARTALEALRRLHACAARPVPQPAEKKILCVCVCVCVPGLTPGGAAACHRESRGSCTRAAQESRGAGRLREIAGSCGSPRLPTATAGSGRCVCSRGLHAQPAQSRQPNACPYCAIPHPCRQLQLSEDADGATDMATDM